MAHRLTWKGGSLGTDQGRWGTGSDWSAGQVPQSGDDVLVNGVANSGIDHSGEAITFPGGSGYTSIYLFPQQPASVAQNDPQELKGYVISGETIALDGITGPPELWLQATTLSQDVISVTGTVVLQSYLNNLVSGPLHVGTNNQAATLQFQLYGVDTAGSGLNTVPATSLGGHTIIADGSALRVIALTSEEPADNFRVNGEVTAEAGATLFVDDTDGSGIETGADNNTDVINNGVIDLQGAAGKTTTASITANTIGGGSIDVIGNGAVRSSTTLTLNGNVTGQHIMLDDGTIAINDAALVIGDPSQQGFAVTGGSFTFGPDGGTLLLHQPPLTTLVFGGNGGKQEPDGQHPFTTPIDGFGAGDTIGLVKAAQGESFYTVWDQAKHLLSVDFQPSLQGNPPGIQAQFTLEGTYQSGGFQLTADQSSELLSLTYSGPHS